MINLKLRRIWSVREKRQQKLIPVNPIHVVIKTAPVTEKFATFMTLIRRPFYKLKQKIMEKYVNKEGRKTF